MSEKLITFTLPASKAEDLSGGLSDLLCWCRGFNAAISPDDGFERRPIGVEAARDLNIILKDELARKEP